MKLFRRIHREESGFTLVELLIVAAIIAILAAIAVPRLSGTRDRARIAAGKSALGTINTAMGMYYAENGAYPGSTEDGTVTVTNGGIGDFNTELGSYLDNLNELLGDWAVDDYNSTNTSFSLAIGPDPNGDGTVETGDILLTMDQSGNITEGTK